MLNNNKNNKLKIGFQYSKHSHLSLYEQINDAKNNNINLFDIFFDDFFIDDIPEKTIQYINQLKKENFIFSIHSPIINYIDNYPILDKLIDFSNQIEPFSITFHFDKISLKELEYLNRKLNDNIKISIENTIPDISFDNMNYIEKMNMLSLHINNLYSTFDIGHCNINCNNNNKNSIKVEEYIDKLFENNIRISTFHFHNNYGIIDSHNNLQEGNIDIKSVLKKTEKIKNDFIIIIENYENRFESLNYITNLL